MKKCYGSWILNNKKTIKAILFFVFLCNQILLSQTFPSGFSQVKVATIADAMSMCFAPDGRLFICQKSGSVRIIKNGLLLPIPFLTLSVNQDIERGIIGITFDPNFNVNHYLYIYYTAITPNIHNKISRYTANGDLVLSGSEFPLLDLEPATSAFHNGGGIGFGMDGKLYLAVGDDYSPDNAQNPNTYNGKVLRLNTDGSAPVDNPYISSNSEITKRIWSYGLRNPYTLSIQAGTGKVFVNDVGSDKWEEINDASLPGKNFGWPIVEGYSTNSSYANPAFAYPHIATGQVGCAIVGGAFFNPTSSNYPGEYTGKYFYMDWCNGWLYYLTLGSTITNTVFSSGLAAMNLALQVGPDGNLYYIKRDIATEGVYKIIYSSNNAPVFTDQPDNVTVSAGQQATFSISVSGAIPLSYQWRKNGTKITGAISSTYNIPNTVYSDSGQYSVMVKNAYDSVLSNTATLTVTAYNDQPNATIITPSANTYYRAGDVISFSGSATDTEDGSIPAANFDWTVEFWHNNNHFHPGPTIPSGIKFGSFAIPTTGESSPIVFYRLKLKVTDLKGLTDTTHVDIVPLVSTISMNTFPAGLLVTYDGQPRATTFSTMAVRGMLISIGAISPQILDGKTYVFKNWQHGDSLSQTILVGEGAISYTAIFNDTALTCTASGTINREFWANVTGTSVSYVPVNTIPTNISQLTIFEGPIDVTENYGSRIRGYLCPPLTGNYTFWIASDNNSELWLSTNEQPANKIKIASVAGYTEARGWTKYSSQQSAPKSLVAGVSYYIEAIHKEGTQGDNLAVGWQLPNGTFERPIPGMRLSPYIIPGNSPPTVNITSPGNNVNYPNPSNIIITATALSSGGSITKVEFYQGTTLIGQDFTAPYSFSWMNVATGNYTLKAIATDNTSNTGASQVVNITVTSCPTAPPPTSDKFAVIGDYGFAGSNESAVANLVKSWNPGYIITLGDNNYELGESSTIDANIGQYYHDYIYPYSGSYGAGADSNRFFPSLGNHDLNTDSGSAYLQYFTLPGNERYYDYIKGNIHFFVLNSDPREADGNDSSSIQALWLKNTLQNSTSKWNVIYFHHSPYCSDAAHGSQTYMQWPFKDWGAHVVLSGHSHVYERLMVDGFPYFVAGVGGKSLHSFEPTPLPETIFRYNSNFGAMLCNEYADTLAFRFYNKTGTLIDSYYLTKPPFSIVISAPPNNATFSFGTPVVINATVTGASGGISKVDFYSDTIKLGTDSIYPYSFSWTNVPLGNYSLTAFATDNSNNNVSSPPSTISVVIPCASTGKITRDYWANVSGTSIANIPLNTVPTNTSQLTIFEEPSNTADNYGSRIRGYICPPVSGNYTFWIASDDNSELWLSTNELVLNKVKIASVSGYTSSRQWTKYAGQQSAPISLIAGTQYYIEALHKEGTQGDNLAVGWQLPNGVLERPIPGIRLSPIVIPLVATISSPANNSSFIEGADITIQADISGGTGTIQKVEFFADTIKLGEDTTSPYSFLWNNVIQGNYELKAKVTDSENDTALSSIVTVSVIPQVTCNTTGTISREVWNNVSSSNVSSIPLSTQPNSTGQLTIFQTPENAGDNYGQRISGYVCPPVTGNYIFWIASDDNSELWLSTDDDPTNKQKIASVTGYTSPLQWTKYSTQQSASKNLIAGQKYYIEVLHKEATQGDNCAVGWQLPNGTLERPIPGTRLSPFTIPLLINISQPENNSSFSAGSSITIQAAVSGGTGTIQKVEFFADTIKLGEDITSPYSFVWNNVIQGNYELTVKATDSENDTAMSSIVTVSVIPQVTCNATGTISREVWNNVSSSNVSSIPVSTQPNSTGQLTIFQAPENAGDNYGQRISGYVCPPVTGNYIFWIASDNSSELWLSTDDDPTNKQKIASVTGYTSPLQWTKYSTQQSASKNLIAGQKYYIEVLHKEGTQGDNCAVGWQLPDGTQERPMPGTRLSPFTIPLLINISQPENNSSFSAGSNITIQAAVSGGTGTIQKVEFFADSTKIAEDETSPYSFVWNDVIAGNYELTAKVTDSGNDSAVSSTVTISVSSIVACSAAGSIAREVWSNVSGSSVSAIPLSINPSSTGQLTIFEAPQNFANNYGQRISGYVCPPLTGNYIFWIASDNNSELWLSSDETTANKQKIASVSGYTSSRQWTKYSTQKSVSKNLIAGRNYYIEALHKEGSQGDNCAVGWQLPSGVQERPIPGNRLSPFELIPSIQLISAGSSWKYLDNGTNQGTAWRASSFNDATWKTGNAEFGYGDGGEATVISYGSSSTNKYITTYFRKTFTVTDISTISGLELSLIRDDGAVVYINGVEVYRNNLSSGTVFYNTLAPTIIDATKESIYVIANISSSTLVNGTNHIAVEIHQNAKTSPDMSFNLKLKTLSGSRIMENEMTNDTTQENTILENKVEMIVYPNPNTGQFNLELCIDDLQEKNVVIEVTNSFGIVIYKKQPQKIKGCIKETIELESSLPVGVYIMKVIIDDKIQTAKMLLTR